MPQEVVTLRPSNRLFQGREYRGSHLHISHCCMTRQGGVRSTPYRLSPKPGSGTSSFVRAGIGAQEFRGHLTYFGLGLSMVSPDISWEVSAMAKERLTAEEIEAIQVRYELISKWGEDTIATFEKSIKTYRSSDRLCITTLSVCSTYCNAIRALLQNGLRMPTKALLRVLFEVSAKVLWCLKERDTDGSNSAVEKRMQRWEKESLRQKIKLAYDYQNIISDRNRDTLEQRVKEYKERQDQLKCV